MDKSPWGHRMGLPPTWLNLTCYTVRIAPPAGFVQLRFSQHQAFFQTKPQRVKKAASGHSFPYPVTPLRTNLTTCAMRQPRTGLACPPHFSRVRTKINLPLFYHIFRILASAKHCQFHVKTLSILSDCPDPAGPGAHLSLVSCHSSLTYSALTYSALSPFGAKNK